MVVELQAQMGWKIAAAIRKQAQAMPTQWAWNG